MPYWPVTPRYTEVLRGSHSWVCEATHRNPVTGTLTSLSIKDGSVAVDETSRTRRTLNLTLPPEQATWDVLDAAAGEITVVQKMLYLDGLTETVPVIVAVVGQDSFAVGSNGSVQVTAPDRWVHVAWSPMRAGSRSSVASNPAYLEIKRLIEAAWPAGYPFPGWAQLDDSATDLVGSMFWDNGSREEAVMGDSGLASTRGLEVFFEQTGLGILRPVPVVTSTASPVYTIDAGSSGVLIKDSATITRDRGGFKNAVTVTTNATDVTFEPVTVENSDPTDPQSTVGPWGFIGEEWSGNFRNSTLAAAAARARLAKRLAGAKQITLSASPNLALDVGDVISVLLPQTDKNMDRISETHVVTTITHPLVPTGEQTIATRSTQANLDAA